MRLRISLKPILALGSAALVAALAWFGLPLMRRRERRLDAQRAVAAALGCLLDSEPPAEPRWRRRRIAADAEASDDAWPERCRPLLMRAHTALRSAAIREARCAGTCCPGDAACAALTHLLALFMQVESAPLVRLSAGAAATLLDLARAAHLELARAAGIARPEPAELLVAGALPVLSDDVRAVSTERATKDALPIVLDRSPSGPLRCELALSGPAVARCGLAGPEPSESDFARAAADQARETFHRAGIARADSPLRVSPCEAQSARTARVVLDAADRSFIAIEQAGTMRSALVAADPSAGFSCYRDRASLSWIDSLGAEDSQGIVRSRYALFRVVCGAAPSAGALDCLRQRSEVALRRASSQSPVLIADLDRAVALIYQGALGETRLRVASLGLFASARDRPVFDDAGHGGFALEAASLYAHAGVAVMVLPAKDGALARPIRALRLDASGRVEPFATSPQAE